MVPQSDNGGSRKIVFLSKTRILIVVCLIVFVTLSVLYYAGILIRGSSLEETAKLPAYRLRGNVLPSHYHLEIITDLDNFTFQGKVWIQLECVKGATTIYLHARNLTIPEKEATLMQVLNENEMKELSILSIKNDEKNELLGINLAEPVTPEKNYTLYLPFSGVLSEGLAGYYRSSYHDRTTNTTKWMAVTQFEPTDARRAFPCFDEPGVKATFKIKMAHNNTLKSASNMPLIRSVPFDGREGWVWSEFQDTVPMSTYLVAFMVSDFDFRESDPTPNNVEFRVWARKDAIDQVGFAREVGPRVLSYYEQYFDVGYPLPKQDMVAIPDFSYGAMENWGLITYRETELLYDEKSTSKAAQYTVANTIAHELAHQWFGNLVTMKWWTDLWLNEGFATYVAVLGVHHEFPEWNSLNMETVETALDVYWLDALKSSHPVCAPIDHPSEIQQIFDTISYQKGSFLLRMMNLFLGEDVFRHGVSEYLKKHRYGNAEQDDLWASLSEQAHKSQVLPANLTVKRIMDSWTLHTGYPVITVTRDYDSGKAVVTQKRFLAVREDSEHEPEGSWWVPLTYFSPYHSDVNETLPQSWLSGDEHEALVDTGAAPHDWVIFNNQFAGLFRVNYDENNWLLIAEALNSPQFESIHLLNRVQITTDALDLAFHGDLSYATAIKVISYLHQETEYLPWRAGLGRLGDLNTILRRTPKYANFRTFMQKLVEPIYGKFSNMTETPSTFEGVKHQYLIVTWACHLRVGGCEAQAVQMFNDWWTSEDPDANNVIPKDLRYPVYCYGVKAGGEEAWNFLWQRYLNSNVGSEKSLILRALSCSQDTWILERYLDWSINENSGIRRQDSQSVFANVASKSIGYYLAHQFFMRNIRKIYDYHSPNSMIMGRYVDSLTDQMIYEDELDELRHLTHCHQDLLQDSHLQVDQSLEAALINTLWMKDNYHTFTDTLTPTL